MLKLHLNYNLSFYCKDPAGTNHSARNCPNKNAWIRSLAAASGAVCAPSLDQDALSNTQSVASGAPFLGNA